jgi:phosphoribosylformylglycinamidine synthase
MTPAGPGLGAHLTIPGTLRPDVLLFGESASRILVSVRATDAAALEAIAAGAGSPCARLGTVGGESLLVSGMGFTLRLPVAAAHQAWATGLGELLG